MSKDIRRIEIILDKIEYLNNILDKFDGKISKALEDKIVFRPALLMHLVAIAEQFDKLKKENSPLLTQFPGTHTKGIYDVRTFIAHDYEGINISVIENVIRYGIPDISNICKEIINK
ncbi:MAG: hypothetical protein U9O56_07990 [Campylobacterota bacterium]|nr:hypothetical protein [Campylobacterota bacterium]